MIEAATTYAGDDPLNGSDPTGLCVSTPFGCIGPGPANGISGTVGAIWNDTGGTAVHGIKVAAVDTGHFLSDPNRWRSEANYWAGVANGIVSTVTIGQVHIAAPYCNTLSWAYGLGSGFGFTASAVAGGEAVDAIRGALGTAELTTAEAGSGEALSISAEDSWGDSNSLEDHYLRHGADFGSTSAAEYANQASEFLQEALQERLPAKVDSDGVIRVYDPSGDTFGAYNPQRHYTNVLQTQ